MTYQETANKIKMDQQIKKQKVAQEIIEEKRKFDAIYAKLRKERLKKNE